jgi:dihydrodipicolinate synthase/N-acetylneuraminate lyase
VFGDSVDIFAGTAYMFPGILYGLAGALNPPLAYAIDAGVALLSSIKAGDMEESLRIQLALLRFLEGLESFTGSWGSFRPGQLEALRHLGFDVKMFPRWPTEPISALDRAKLHSIIDDIHSAAQPAP